MLDNSVKTLMVDESQTLKNLLPVICAKIGKAGSEKLPCFLMNSLLSWIFKDGRSEASRSMALSFT